MFFLRVTVLTLSMQAEELNQLAIRFTIKEMPKFVQKLCDTTN